MRGDDLVLALRRAYPEELCRDLVSEYQQLRLDVALGTLCRSTPGKIVETLAQMLEFSSTGLYSQSPKVDSILTRVQQCTSLDDGLRLCAARVGLAMYALRNKRGIIHKSGISPNRPDLYFLLSATQWIMAELVRQASTAGMPMQQAAELINLVQAPVGSLVEDTGERRLVLVDCTAREEIVLLLQSYYPERLAWSEMLRCLDRIPEKTVRNVIRSLWLKKLLDGSVEVGYKATTKGLGEAASIARQLRAA